MQTETDENQIITAMKYYPCVCLNCGIDKTPITQAEHSTWKSFRVCTNYHSALDLIVPIVHSQLEMSNVNCTAHCQVLSLPGQPHMSVECECGSARCQPLAGLCTFRCLNHFSRQLHRPVSMKLGKLSSTCYWWSLKTQTRTGYISCRALDLTTI